MLYHIIRIYWDGEQWITQDVPHTYTTSEVLACELRDIFIRMAVVNGERLSDVLYRVRGE